MVIFNDEPKKQIVVGSEEELVPSLFIKFLCVLHTSWLWFLKWFVTNINVTVVKKKP